MLNKGYIKIKSILLELSLVIVFTSTILLMLNYLWEEDFKFLWDDVINTRITQWLNKTSLHIYSNENILRNWNKILLKKRFKRQKESDINYVSYKCDKLEWKYCKDQRINLLKIVNSNLFNKKIRPIYIEFKDELMEPRAYTIWHEVTLSSKLSEEEQAKLLVHELWHVIDVFFLRRREDFDISDWFYNLSWKDENTKLSTSKVDDFVSGYAMSNYYEDFAESLTFYVFYNDSFLEKTKNNRILEQKYNFINKVIFKNNEFVWTNFTEWDIPEYVWDSTKIKIDLNLFLNSI